MADVELLIPKRTLPTLMVNADLVEMDVATMVEIPLLGTVAAGHPIATFEQQESVSVPAHMVRRDTYALRVKGNSMVDEQIVDGDIIVVQCQASAENGQSVVAMIHGQEVTLKRFFISSDGVRLQPANTEMEPIFLRHEEIKILGVVIGLIRQP